MHKNIIECISAIVYHLAKHYVSNRKFCAFRSKEKKYTKEENTYLPPLVDSCTRIFFCFVRGEQSLNCLAFLKEDGCFFRWTSFFRHNTSIRVGFF